MVNGLGNRTLARRVVGHRMSECQSCNVMDGHWLMYEQPNYRGKMMYMKPGEYRNMRDMGTSGSTRFNSFRRITDSC
ncbi:unnamed protein product [Boreogadus saida]